MQHRRTLKAAATAALMALVLPVGARADETVSTFTLDSLSFVSFGDDEAVPLPPGSTITFRFGTPAPDGSVRFEIRPQDVDIAPIDLPGGKGRLEYTLRSTAQGELAPTPSGRKLIFDATVRATLVRRSERGSFDYSVPFSTEEARATSRDGSQERSASGMRVVEGVWFAQIVGATTNKANAYPEPGAAVYTVLSGQFDTMP